jgi:hypothetical protein
MNDGVSTQAAEDEVRRRFADQGLSGLDLRIREYPEETILIVRVADVEYDRAVLLGNELDRLLAAKGFSGFVTVRKKDSRDTTHLLQDVGVADQKATDLANLLEARSRTSEIQPSLTYIPDAANNLSAIVEARHHLVFGRRGAGKTALLVEGKRVVEAQGHATVWANIQTYRHEGSYRTFIWIAKAILDRLTVLSKSRSQQLGAEIASLDAEIDKALAQPAVEHQIAERLVPKLQRVVRRAVDTAACKLYIFLDDLHYVSRSDQPLLLDLVHGIVRDADAWLKIASIRHLSRWYQATPPLGLQSGHDAAHIDLDLTLESPTDAKRFLDAMLDSYAAHVGLRSARSVFSEDALNRLVLAAGAVPRDHLVLSAGAIRQAKRRANARQAGVQDVNRSAGDQSKVKVAELEDDAAAEGAGKILEALNTVRAFCLDDKKYTYCKVDFHDKETRPGEYALVQGLLDVRILHLISPSLSDKHQAGRRAEVFMLDLSQFSGQRLKKYLHVLDFVGGHIVLKRTSTTEPAKVGNTPRKLQEILRRGPEFSLDRLSLGGAAVPDPLPGA